MGMSQNLKAQAAHRGLGAVKKVLDTFTFGHVGWEMDNYGWFVETVEGKVRALTTDHGGVTAWTKEEASQKLKELTKQQDDLVRALNNWPKE